MAEALLESFQGVGLPSAVSKNLSKGEVGLQFDLEDGSKLRGDVCYWRHYRFMRLRLGTVLSFTVSEGHVILEEEEGGIGPVRLAVSEIRNLRSVRPMRGG